MFEGSSFGKTLSILKREMDVSVLRRQVIANNIANADTPNFKRSVVDFESQLKRALDSEKPTGQLEAKMTNQRDIPFHRSIDWRTVGPRRVLDYLSTSDNNGNNVDLEQEMMDSLNNQLEYQLLTQSVTSQFARINVVLR
ncbi:MAG TPA: flagellar basal body rod protein FlgB [Spirochaetia bacterium]|nr:flagellar basal body rod protein FlgB [Spirochaetia bacterium]